MIFDVNQPNAANTWQNYVPQNTIPTPKYGTSQVLSDLLAAGETIH